MDSAPSPAAALAHRLRELTTAAGPDDRRMDQMVDVIGTLDETLSVDESQDESLVVLLAEVISAFEPVAGRYPSSGPVLSLLLDAVARLYNRMGRPQLALPFAQRQVEVLRAFPAARPAVLLGRGQASARLGSTLLALERHQEALAAAQDAVAQVRNSGAPDDEMRPALASHLVLLGRCLESVHRREEAAAAVEEAVSVEAQLRLADPGRRPQHLADALNELGRLLFGLNRYQAAAAAVREEVALRRSIAAEDRTIESRDLLVRALENLQFCLEPTGQRSEAINVAAEVVALLRAGPARSGEPDAAKLPRALAHLADALFAAQRLAEANQVAAEAILLYRPLAAANVLAIDQLEYFAHTVDLARSCLAKSGQFAAALAPGREYVALCRRLAQLRPDRYLSWLVTALRTLSHLLAATGAHHEAAWARTEAANIERSMVGRSG